MDQKDETEENFGESYSLATRYDRIRGLRPNASYTSSYSETVEEPFVGGGGTGGAGVGTTGLRKAAPARTGGLLWRRSDA